MFDILDLKEKFDYTRHVRQIIGFNSSADHSQDKHRAVDGIAWVRFLDHRSDLAIKDAALAALRRHRRIEADFRKLLPEIKW